MAVRDILIDTNVYTAFKRGMPSVVECFRNVDSIGLEVVVVGELLAGFKGGKYERRNQKELQSFIDSPRVRFLAHGWRTSEFYGVLFNRLKAAGTPIPANDIWIAAVAMEYGRTLCTLDKHFNVVEGVVLYPLKREN